MPRIAGIDIPNEKVVGISLTYIYGIGRTTAQKMCEDLKIDPSKRARDLTEDEITHVAGYIDKNLIVEGQLRRVEQDNVTRLRKISCYRGIRHARGLPVRGQRTRTNARTRKGRRKTVANKKIATK